jgi:uncharacterized glyoxalase superfamily protein PhnB
MKAGELVIIVESVNQAVKFYTEKLGFDINEALISSQPEELSFARLKKGKCIIVFKQPDVAELAEFSFIKRCVSRCVKLHVELKTGIEKLYERCQKKKLNIAKALQVNAHGEQYFTVKDPFGVKLEFVQTLEYVPATTKSFLGIKVTDKDIGDEALVENVVEHLKQFGVLRRAAKKYAKHLLRHR